MPKLSPQEAADKQVRNIKASIEQIKASINKVTENPCALAAAQEDKMLAKITESITSGKWARSLRRVSLTDWKTAFITKGVSRIGTGAEAAKPKLIKFYTEFFPYLETVQAETKVMPNLNIDDAIAIAAHNIRRISEFKRV